VAHRFENQSRWLSRFDWAVQAAKFSFADEISGKKQKKTSRFSAASRSIPGDHREEKEEEEEEEENNHPASAASAEAHKEGKVRNLLSNFLHAPLIEQNQQNQQKMRLGKKTTIKSSQGDRVKQYINNETVMSRIFEECKMRGGVWDGSCKSEVAAFTISQWW
jgi:hypothetical protein